MDQVTLENEWVRLSPIGSEHAEALARIAHVAEVWQYMPVILQTPEQFGQFIQYAQQIQSKGEGLYFAVHHKADEKVVGATGFWNADLNNLRAEIGFTWISPDYQRTAVNTSCKFLLMSHGFETLNLNRIEFKTDSLNTRSRDALKRIGATEEGTLRCHVVQPDGRLRHSVYFSVISEEWPQVKAGLQARLV